MRHTCSPGDPGILCDFNSILTNAEANMFCHVWMPETHFYTKFFPGSRIRMWAYFFEFKGNIFRSRCCPRGQTWLVGGHPDSLSRKRSEIRKCSSLKRPWVAKKGKGYLLCGNTLDSAERMDTHTVHFAECLLLQKSNRGSSFDQR